MRHALYVALRHLLMVTTAATVHASPVHASLVTAAQMAAWTRVAICEEGGWGAAHDAHGPTYFGNLGWTAATWDRFRRPGSPARMDQASAGQQVAAAVAFARYYGFVPDQYGCTGSY